MWDNWQAPKLPPSAETDLESDSDDLDEEPDEVKAENEKERLAEEALLQAEQATQTQPAAVDSAQTTETQHKQQSELPAAAEQPAQPAAQEGKPADAGAGRLEAKRPPITKVKLAKEFSDLVCLRTIKFNGFDTASQGLSFLSYILLYFMSSNFSSLK